MYVVSPNDFVSDRNEAVSSFADDALLLRLALRAIVAGSGEDGEAFRERFPELFDELDGQLEVCNRVMGDVVPWMSGKIDGLRNQLYKGKKIAIYLDDDEARTELFEDGLAFRTDYPVDDELIDDKLKKASTVVDVMRRRMADESRAAG